MAWHRRTRSTGPVSRSYTSRVGVAFWTSRDREGAVHVAPLPRGRGSLKTDTTTRTVYQGVRSSSAASDRRNGSASVTMPTVWMLPRSVSFVTVAGLMSTQATFTHAGSRLPTAIECSVVATIRQKPTPGIVLPHRVLGLQHVGDDLRQRAVVADAAGQDERHVVPDALVHDARS